MAKNKAQLQGVGLERGVKNADAKAASGNLGSYAHQMPMMNNAKRAQPHDGAMPPKGSGKF